MRAGLLGIKLTQPMIHEGLRSLQSNARFQTAHEVQPKDIVRRQPHRAAVQPGITLKNPRLSGEGQPKIGGGFDALTEEALIGNANNDERSAIQDDRPTRDVPSEVETILPKAVADDSYGGSGRRIVGRFENASHGGVYAQGVEVVARNEMYDRLLLRARFRQTGNVHGHPVRAFAKRTEALKRVVMPLKVFVGRIRKRVVGIVVPVVRSAPNRVAEERQVRWIANR